MTENQKPSKPKSSSVAKPLVTSDKGNSKSSSSKAQSSSKVSKSSRQKRRKSPSVEGNGTKNENRQRFRTKTVLDLMKLKGSQNIVGLTAYDALLGRAVSDSGVDFILVGDSVGTTLLGHKTTIPVTIGDMIHHTSAVRRSNPQCLLVADLPFGEASLSFDRLLESARALMQQGGADAVKIEGGRDVADDIEKLVATGVPVMGHIGLLPQTVKAIGGYRKFGGTPEEAESLYRDAISLEEAGCFALIAEMIEENVATELASQILPPLIGIGCGDSCDGQILVTTDLLGWSNGPVPPFVQPRLNLNDQIGNALNSYVDDLKNPGSKK